MYLGHCLHSLRRSIRINKPDIFGQLYQRYHASLSLSEIHNGCNSGQCPFVIAVVVQAHQRNRPFSKTILPYVRIGILGRNMCILWQYKTLSFSVRFPDDSASFNLV